MAGLGRKGPCARAPEIRGARQGSKLSRDCSVAYYGRTLVKSCLIRRAYQVRCGNLRGGGDVPSVSGEALCCSGPVGGSRAALHPCGARIQFCWRLAVRRSRRKLHTVY